MYTLTDPVLQGKKDPSQDYLNNFVIKGGGEVIEQKLKEMCDWNGETPVAAVGIHIEDAGEVNQAELFVFGVKEAGRVATNMLYGDVFGAESYVRVNPVDLGPIILVGRETKMELLPAEPRDAEFGLGFILFFLYKGDKEVVELPEFVKVREAVEGLFNNSCKVKEHKKFTMQKSSAVQGEW